MENSINKYFNMLLVGHKIETISIAIKLKLFTFIEKEDLEARFLASKLNCDLENTKILLDALVMLNLIYRENKIYKNEKISKKYFVSTSLNYSGDIFLHKKEMLTIAQNSLEGFIKGGKNILTDMKHEKKWADSAKKNLKQEQKSLVCEAVVSLVNNLKEFPKMKKILDLGCSSGILGLEIVKSHPSLCATLFDYKEVTDIAKENIIEYKLENRAKILSGDIQEDDIGQGYDLIWCSNIFYFLKNKEEVIKKIYNALNPNGILVSSHVEIDKRNKTHEDNFFYFLSLSLQGRDVLKPIELSYVFEEVGFRSINSYTTFELLTPTQIYIVKK